MRRVFYGVIIGLVGLLGLWYFFMRTYDYRIFYNTQASPGTINQSLKTWTRSLGNEYILFQDDLFNIHTEYTSEDNNIQYCWEIKPLDDDNTRIAVYINDKNNGALQRMIMPLLDTEYERRTRNTVTDFFEVLQDHLRSFSISNIEISETPGVFAVCIPTKDVQMNKVSGMLKHYGSLDSYFFENKIPLKGNPFVSLSYWNKSNDSIYFDFCYPTLNSASFPKNDEFEYKEFKGQKSLKVIYKGNYLTSDRAWYALLDYAQNYGYEVEGYPVEVFFSNPNMGGDEREWRADIYLPIN